MIEHSKAIASNSALPIDMKVHGQHALPEHKAPDHHAIAVSSIFSFLIAIFGLYLCMKVMLPQQRFERNTNLTVFYLAAFAFLVISVIPF